MSPIPSFQNLEYKTTVTGENFDLLFEKYAPMVYGIILRAVKEDLSLAEKLTGSAFVQLYRNIHCYNSNNRPFIAWMFSNIIKTMDEHGYKSQLLSVISRHRNSGSFSMPESASSIATV